MISAYLVYFHPTGHGHSIGSTLTPVYTMPRVHFFVDVIALYSCLAPPVCACILACVRACVRQVCHKPDSYGALGEVEDEGLAGDNDAQVSFSTRLLWINTPPFVLCVRGSQDRHRVGVHFF